MCLPHVRGCGDVEIRRVQTSYLRRVLGDGGLLGLVQVGGGE